MGLSGASTVSTRAAGRAGLAHYAEHVMWEAGTIPGVTLYSNAFTTYSSTHFTSIALDGELDRALEMEARRLERPCVTLPEGLLARERDDDTDGRIAAIRGLTVEAVIAAAADFAPDRRIVIVRGPRRSVETAFATLDVDRALVEWTLPE